MSAMQTLFGLAGLGDVPGTQSDASYTGAPATSADSSLMSVDYYRNKVREFQDTMNALDSTLQTLGSMRELIDPANTDAVAQWEDMWNQGLSKASEFRGAAEAINLAASGLNAINVRFPEVSVPQTLQALPLLAMAGIAAAVAAAAALIAWALNYISSVQAWARTQSLLKLVPADKQADWAQKQLALDQASQAASGSTLSQLSSIIKWVAIGGALWFAYKAFFKGAAQ